MMSESLETEVWMTQSAANGYPVYIYTVVYKISSKKRQSHISKHRSTGSS